MMTQPEIETHSNQPERFNTFTPFGAPGFDMESPLQFRLFDPQICGELQADWLAYAVKSHGITRAELDVLIAGKLLRLRIDGAGREGFLLYTEQQARLAKKLQASGRGVPGLICTSGEETHWTRRAYGTGKEVPT